MKLFVSLQGHFIRYKDAVFPTTFITYNNFWKRYLDVFEEVLVLARVFHVKTKPNDKTRANGPGVIFHDLPEHRGLGEYLRVWPRLYDQINRAVQQHYGAIILRVPCHIGSIVWKSLRKKNRPFAIEIVGDPWDLFAPGSYQSIARPLIRRWSTHNLRVQCQEAIATAYVTKEALQQRYPPKSFDHVFYSSIELPSQIFEEEFCSLSFKKANSNSPKRLIFVGTLFKLYKGQDVLLKAVARCIQKGLDLELLIIGDGIYREYLENLTNKLNIKASVRFLGKLAYEKIFQELKKAHMFILPSRQEGLPRSMIEAMASGLPCIGSTVGGIPELLSPEDLVPPGDAKALAQKIQELVEDPERMNRMAKRNFRTAQEYRPEILKNRREQFYKRIRELTEMWYVNNIK